MSYKFKIIPNEQTPPVDFSKSTEDILKEDYDLMCAFLRFARSQPYCAGLAANQVCLRNRGEERIKLPFFAIRSKLNWDILIHPKITSYSDQPITKKEGCLTWPGKYFKAVRWPVIQVSYHRLNGDFIENIFLQSFEGQVFQHEYDHLNGIEENILD